MSPAPTPKRSARLDRNLPAPSQPIAKPATRSHALGGGVTPVSMSSIQPELRMISMLMSRMPRMANPRSTSRTGSRSAGAMGVTLVRLDSRAANHLAPLLDLGLHE